VIILSLEHFILMAPRYLMSYNLTSLRDDLNQATRVGNSQIQLHHNRISLALDITQALVSRQAESRVQIRQRMLDDLFGPGLAPYNHSVQPWSADCAAFNSRMSSAN